VIECDGGDFTQPTTLTENIYSNRGRAVQMNRFRKRLGLTAHLLHVWNSYRKLLP